MAINDWSGHVIGMGWEWGKYTVMINRVAEPGFLSGVGGRTQ